MPAIDCGAAQLHYELTGSGSGPCVAFSNSLGTNLEMWKPQMTAFETKYRVLRYDMRGHGGSSVPSGPYTIAQLGTDFLGLLDQLGLDQVIFCGLSIGGVIGQWLAAEAPQRIEKLVLCNTAAKIGSPETWNARIDQVRKEGLQSVADAVISRWFTPDYAGSHPAEVAEMRSVLISTNPDGYIACCEAIRDMDQREMVAKISVPTLIVAGDADPVTTVQDGKWLQQAIRGSELAVVHGSHISNIEASAEFNAAVLRFVGERLR